ncbi:MAG: DUF861 domain-containing protein [Phreatobacter sp.]|uniref:cupin domain-containing protein n=1 Tax=Phreatobacter sp. TaxID=1966341 RepID=UPI001A380C8B|nr:cupin domain-containing protein [Phreatobacter sp.]MBL8567795.1 DUF861 domain-containing protein [Phreatobacter sp.]
MSQASFVAASLADLDLDPAPIRPEWILEGNPVARCRHWSDSSDGTTQAMAWDCTAGAFRWFFGGDEIVHIIEGEVNVTDEAGGTRTLRPGDAALFRAGTWSVWRVPHYVRKHAICRDSLPAVVTLPLKAGRKASRLAARLRDWLPEPIPVRVAMPIAAAGALAAVGVFAM